MAFKVFINELFIFISNYLGPCLAVYFKSIVYGGYFIHNTYVITIQHGIILFCNQIYPKRISIITYDNLGYDTLALVGKLAKMIYYDKCHFWIRFFDIDKAIRYCTPWWIDNGIYVADFFLCIFMFIYVADRVLMSQDYYEDELEPNYPLYKKIYIAYDEFRVDHFKYKVKVYSYILFLYLESNYYLTKNETIEIITRLYFKLKLDDRRFYFHMSLIHMGFLYLFILIPISMIYKIIILPLLIIIIIFLCTNKKIIKNFALLFSLYIFNYLLFVLFKVVKMNVKLKMISFHQLFIYKNLNTFFDIFLGIDNLSLIFLILTSFLFLIVFLYLYTYEEKNIKFFFSLLFILEFFIFNSFIHYNLFWFFFFFESMVFPMFLIILLGGSRSQKIKASYYFVFFTIIGSIFLFISINYLLIQFDTVNIYKLYWYKNNLTLYEQQFLWLSFFFSFAVKIPIYPFHTWLPEAHVEAPTVGSILLAGILLKLGCYGIIRILLTLFPLANLYFSSYVYILCLISIFHSCIIGIRQTDIKRIIAYASIAHMNLIVIGLFSFNNLGIYGGIFQSVSHGIVASGLFFLVGILYTRYKSRIIQYYSGLAQVMPLYSFSFLFFTMANISFPLTSNFIGELLLFLGISKIGFYMLFLSLLSIIFNTIYSLWFCNRILYGNTKSHLISLYNDLSQLELFIISILIFFIILFGIFPNMINIGNMTVFIDSIIYNHTDKTWIS
jgi:NADH-quinone oxidoreductase subunit M